MIRIFIIGTARAGTTLLQSMIAAHPDVISIPELHYFDRKIHKQKILRLFDIITKNDASDIKTFFHKIDPRLNLKHYNIRYLHSKSLWTKKLVKTMDQLATLHKCKAWLEKTPINLYYIDLIKKNIPNVKFIHILRKPEDNIASLYQASKTNKDYFKQDSIDKCIKRYIADYKLHTKFKEKGNHFYLSYEQLMENPQSVLQKVCTFIELKYFDDMLNYTENVRNLIDKNEEWKANNLNPDFIISNKKKEIFSEKQLEYIKKQTAFININEFIKD